MSIPGLHPLLADDLQGRIESVDQADRSFVVQGVRVHVTDSTDDDDGLKGFGDLREGQKVEVDFLYRAGRHSAAVIEVED